jgi:cyclopropane-fatty-acyl-phospholipid synthase
MEFPIDLDAIARGEVSDDKIRKAIRLGLAFDLRRRDRDVEDQARREIELVQELRRSAVTIETEAANRQHYEVPADFFRLVLGRRLKYSCGYWPAADTDLDASEEAMLERVCERARIEDGQQILDLGCGWGSLSLYLAERYPRCRVLGLSNSTSQRQAILAAAAARGLGNVEIETADVGRWTTARRFDRVVSIEMMEHVRNHEVLLARIASWLLPDGLLFVHIFTHQHHAYPSVNNWMAGAFFTGGIVPSDHLLLHFQRDVQILDRWRVDGRHYQRTSEAWLARLDARREAVLEVFGRAQPPAEALRTLVSWRLFFMTCAESFGFDSGRQWMVSHYLFGRQR